MNNVRPQIKMLTEEQIQDIHQYTLKLLATTGVRVDSPSAVEMLTKKVGISNVDGRTVRIPEELVEWALKVAPRQIQIYDRRGNPQIQDRRGRGSDALRDRRHGLVLSGAGYGYAGLVPAQTYAGHGPRRE